ncbi:hypothetical protein FUAX_26430 [Fulvitalea axinellae]|uniref:HAMP domain-containing protein n=1 Tax=Fulvitalea axinellae TaxID=1182444 RepID=A0AAU9DB13_9BACT|nr:hypothetical protein FUAX_26430 [Fulvitalea axinellae]
MFKFSSIKLKFRLAFFGLIFLSAIGGGLSFVLLEKVGGFHETERQIRDVVSLLDACRGAEKDFLLYGSKSPSFFKTFEDTAVTTHAESVKRINVILNSLKKDENLEDLGLVGDVSGLQAAIVSYSRCFDKLVEAKYQRGFKDWGLVGRMRRYVHDLQQCPSAQEKVFAFSLRRHEKDFMLRQDERYADKLQKTARDFQEFVREASLPHMSASYVEEYSGVIDAYVRQFEKVVEIDRLIGFTADSGLSGQLADIVADAEPRVESLYDGIRIKSEEMEARALWVSSVALALLLIVGGMLSFYFSSVISRPIRVLDRVAKSVLKGDRKQDKVLEKFHLNDEMGSLIKNFRSMLKQIRKQVDQIKLKNEALEAKGKEDKARRKHAEGMADLAGILRKYRTSKNVLCEEVLNFLMSFTNANMGGLFVREEEVMKMCATYASGKRKYMESEFRKGEGLVGRVWQERSAVRMNDLPEEYMKIRSGLGEVSPKYVCLEPVAHGDGEVNGVLELAWLKEPDEQMLEFANAVAEQLSYALDAMYMQETTATLLNESRAMSEELQSNEEELRQNLEEMAATRESLEGVINEKAEQISLQASRGDMFRDLLKAKFGEMLVADADFRIVSAEAESWGNIEKMLNPDLVEKLAKDEALVLDGYGTYNDVKIGGRTVKSVEVYRRRAKGEVFYLLLFSYSQKTELVDG